MVCGHCPMTFSLTINERLKWLSSLSILMQESFLWWQCSDRYIISLFPNLHNLFSPSLISLVVSVDVKHHVYLFIDSRILSAQQSSNRRCYPDSRVLFEQQSTNCTDYPDSSVLFAQRRSHYLTALSYSHSTAIIAGTILTSYSRVSFADHSRNWRYFPNI